MARFLRWLIYVQSALLGAACIALAVDPGLWDLAIERVERYYEGELLIAGRVLAGAFGALQILTLIALMVRWYNQHRFSREVSYNTEYGQVAVSLLAIEEALSRAVENEPGVRKVNIKVREDRVRRCILITANLTLWDVDNVSELNRHCQDLLRKRFSELMPEKTAVQIELTVHRLKHRQPVTRDDGSSNLRRRRTTVGDGPSGLEALTLTPGLAMTRGQTDNDAGAALLAEARQRDRQRREGSNTDHRAAHEDDLTPTVNPVLPADGEAAAAVEAVRRMQEAASRGITVATEVPPDEQRATPKQITATFRYDSDASISADAPLEASTVIPRDDDDQRDTQPRAATNAITDDGMEQFDDLYFGPTYPVASDEEPDYSGQALPAERPPQRPKQS